MNARSTLPLLVALALGVGAYAFSVKHLKTIPPIRTADTLRVAVPPAIQIFVAGGDRYLAANTAVLRATLVGTDGRFDPDTIAILGRVHVDAAVLNPYHEDNYYLAEAILPWANNVKDAQTVLRLATQVRIHDAQPPFYLGFNEAYFNADFAKAGEAFNIAAERSPDEGMRLSLKVLAIRWLERSDDLTMAINITKALRDGSRDKALQQYLDVRVVRLSYLKQLRDLAAEYKKKYGKPITAIDDLVKSGLARVIPADPIGGAGFALDKNGEIVLRSSLPENNPYFKGSPNAKFH